MSMAAAAAAFLASVVVVLGAIAGVTRYLARRVRRAVLEWRAVQYGAARASTETAELARVMRHQIGMLVAREYEDRRMLAELLRWRAGHDRHHQTQKGMR